jgi:hypothetical protein
MFTDKNLHLQSQSPEDVQYRMHVVLNCVVNTAHNDLSLLEI